MPNSRIRMLTLRLVDIATVLIQRKYKHLGNDSNINPGVNVDTHFRQYYVHKKSQQPGERSSARNKPLRPPIHFVSSPLT